MYDDQALVALIKREHPRLVAAMRLCVGTTDVAEELAQEAFVRLCDHWPKVSAYKHPEAWLYRVAFNAAHSSFRRGMARQRAFRRLRPDASPAGADIDAAITVRQALGQLPTRQRQALVLRYFLQFTSKEAAQVMHCAEGTVRALAAQGLANLRRTPDFNTNRTPR